MKKTSIRKLTENIVGFLFKVADFNRVVNFDRLISWGSCVELCRQICCTQLLYPKNIKKSQTQFPPYAIPKMDPTFKAACGLIQPETEPE